MTGLDDAMYRAARRWSYQAFRTRARQLGWQRGDGDSEERHELRKQLVPLVAADDPALTAEAERLADRWLASRTGVADDLAADTLAVAARHGNTARFERYLAAAGAARDRTEHAQLPGTLGAFTAPEVASRALTLVLGPELDLRDTIGLMFGVLAHRETRELGLAFLTAHLDELLARMRDDEAAWLLSHVAGAFCDADHRRQVAELTVSRAERIGGAQASVARALEQAAQCIALVERLRPALHRVLRVNFTGTR
jgi:hypothetical protein